MHTRQGYADTHSEDNLKSFPRYFQKQIYDRKFDVTTFQQHVCATTHSSDPSASQSSDSTFSFQYSWTLQGWVAGADTVSHFDSKHESLTQVCSQSLRFRPKIEFNALVAALWERAQAKLGLTVYQCKIYFICQIKTILFANTAHYQMTQHCSKN